MPAFDDLDIVAGQGTVGLEIAEQCADLDVTPDDVVVPCSGGGLVAGIALALEARIPGARLDGGACGVRRPPALASQPASVCGTSG